MWYVSWKSCPEIAYAETEHKHNADEIGASLEAAGFTNVWIYPATTTARHSAPRVDEPLIGEMADQLGAVIKTWSPNEQS